jgi:1,4-dihydroxy-2-naphthoate octaprenyltransferase
MKEYASVARAPFLMLPPTLVAAGAAASAWDGAFSWSRTLLAVIGLVALHMAVNILNEWSDMRTGIDLETERTPFSGGSGTLPAGGMGLRAALTFGAGAVAVLAYTDLLARIGIGEIAAGFGLGAGPVIGAGLVQGGGWSAAAVAASIPAFFMTFNLLLLNEFPDEEADRRGGRRNLIILFGRKAAAWIYVFAGLATPAAIVVAIFLRVLPPVCLVAALPSLLLVKPVQWAIKDPAKPVPIPALGANVVWNLATNTVLALTLVAALYLRS